MNPTTTSLSRMVSVHDLDGRGWRRRRSAFWILLLGLLALLLAATSAAGALVVDGGQASEPAATTGTGSAHALAGASPAAKPQVDATSPASSDRARLRGAIQARWDGPTVQLDWRGKTYATAEASFVGDRVASPGDEVVRTLNVKNAGPAGAVMSVELEVGQRIPGAAVNDDLARYIVLVWNVDGVRGEDSFASLLDRRAEDGHLVAQVRVPRGRVASVRVGFRMDRSVTAGRRLGRPSTVLPFDVIVRMHGRTPGHHRLHDLAATGLSRLAGPLGLLGSALVVGGLLLLAARRRICDMCERHLDRRDVVTWHVGSERRVTCHDCFVGVGSSPSSAVAVVSRP